MSAAQYFGLVTMICVAPNLKPGQRTILGGISLLLAVVFTVFGGAKP